MSNKKTSFAVERGGIINPTFVYMEFREPSRVSPESIMELATLQTHATPLRALQCLTFLAVRLGLNPAISDNHTELPDHLLSVDAEADPWADEPTVQVRADEVPQ